MPNEFYSPRINSALFPEFTAKTVRVPCKVISLDGNSAVVEASDGGQISVQLVGKGAEAISETTFVEVIGTVVDNTSIRMLSCIPLGQEFDLSLANKVIGVTFDKRFRYKIFE